MLFKFEYSEAVDRLSTMHGASAKEIRAVRRNLSKQLTNADPSAVMAIARKLLNDLVPGSCFVAYELIHFHKATLNSLTESDLKELGPGLDSWGSVDTFACFLSGPAWRRKQVDNEVIASWARSPDRWRRRSALVSTVPLNNKARGGTGDPIRTLLICGMLVDDRDDMVVKAMSSALRELAKRDPASVEHFLEENQDRLAARVIREVNNKLTTGRKNPKTSKANHSASC